MTNFLPSKKSKTKPVLRQKPSETKRQPGSRGPLPGTGGRPLEANPKNRVLTIRLTEDELLSIRTHADKLRKNVTDYVRDRLMSNRAQ